MGIHSRQVSRLHPTANRGARRGERTRGPTAISYGDFENALRAPGLGLGDVDRQATLNGLP